MASSRLRREIEALLNKRWRVGLDPADPRGAVLGMRTSAVSHAQAEFPPVPFGAIDHGWLAYTSPTLPASIYADTTLAGYLAGSGTAIPDGSETDHLIGPMATDAGRSCQAGHDGLDWTAPPTLDGSAKYDSFAWASAAPANTYAIPHRHSGLGVAFAQALLGAGRKFADILPSGWSYDPTKISLVRGPDRAYWLIKTDSAGCFLTKLTVPGAYYCVNYWLANGLLTGYSAALAEAIVLGNLTLPESPTIYEVLSSAGIAGVYASAAIDLPLWGWQWSEQRVGAPDELAAKAVLVTIYTTGTGAAFRCNSRTTTLTLNWDVDALPIAASLDIQTSGAWRLNRRYERIFRTDESYSPPRLVNWDPSDSTSYYLDVPGPLAAWWDGAAALVTVEWGGLEETAVINNGWPDTNPPITGVGFVSVDQVVYRDAGFVCKVNVGGAEKEIVVAGESTVSTLEFKTAAGAPVSSELSVGGTYGGCTAPNPPSGETWDYTYWPAGEGTYFWSKQDYRSYPGGIFILAFGPPRTCWCRRTETVNSGSITLESKVLPGDRSPALLYDHEYCGAGALTVRPTDYGASWVTTFAYDVLSGDVLKEASALLGSVVVQLDGESAWWDELMAIGVGGYVTTVPLAYMSHGGLAAYTDQPGASPSWVLPGGISFSAPAGDVKGWVGGV